MRLGRVWSLTGSTRRTGPYGPATRRAHAWGYHDRTGMPIIGPQAMSMRQRQQMAQGQPVVSTGGGPNNAPGGAGIGALDPMLYITPGNQPTRGRIGNRVFGDTTSRQNKGDPNDPNSGYQGHLSAERAVTSYPSPVWVRWCWII